MLNYLRGIEDFSMGPMDAICAQLEAIGDPSLPTASQIANLEWLQDAYALWTREYPVEEPLASEIRKLLPVAAAAAITDSDFLIPGAHPVHELMNTIHASAIGWQPQLGRAGVALEQLVAKATEDTGTWLREQTGDLTLICEDLIARAKKDQDRAQRMTQRLVETEKGKFRSASARWKSAEMINHALEGQTATQEIGDFLRGPWYESAQLVLLKYGADSSDWEQMTATTRTLLESLQIDESAVEDQRQQLFYDVTQIPKEVKRWLLSLHMDTEAVNDAIGMIEFTHLRLLRQQSIELASIEPLPIEGMGKDRTAGDALTMIESIHLGQWFAVDSGDGEIKRVQLVLKLGQEQLLQFANKAGIKAMQQSYDDFCELLTEEKATPLNLGASFSICLAKAAGIETVEQAEMFAGKVQPDDEPEPEDSGVAELELELASDPEPEALETIDDVLETIDEEPETDLEDAEQAQREREEAERVQREREEAERVQREREETERVQREQEEAERVQREREETERVQREQEEAERVQREQEEAERIERERETADEEVEILIPMGTWLGFHDGDTPLMAKLAVHDREQDSYIFVNREGIKMRSLNMRELINLMDNNLVDILEARSNFRNEVTRAKKDQD